MGRTEFALGNDEAAALALERVIYFGAGKYDAEAFALMGQIALRKAQYREAASWFDRAAQSDTTENGAYYHTLLKASSLIQEKEVVLAEIDLLGLPDGMPDSLYRAQQYLLGIARFVARDFTGSEDYFKNAVGSSDLKRVQQLDSLFDVLRNIKHPNPKTAKLLSILLPGAGQFYAGDIKNGLNSLLLTGGFFALGLAVGVNYSLIDAAASVVPWIQRYYIGGFNRAARIAATKKQEKQDAVYQKILILAAPRP